MIDAMRAVSKCVQKSDTRHVDYKKLHVQEKTGARATEAARIMYAPLKNQKST